MGAVNRSSDPLGTRPLLQKGDRGDWTFVKRQEAASSLLGPNGASDGSLEWRRRQELGTTVPARATLGQRPHNLFPLPIRGERRRIGWNADPERREELLPSLALGYPSGGPRSSGLLAAALLEKRPTFNVLVAHARPGILEAVISEHCATHLKPSDSCAATSG